MVTKVTVNNREHIIANQGANPPWGEDMYSLLQDLSEVANFAKGADDVVETQNSINNLLTTNPTNITLIKNAIRSFRLDYVINRQGLKEIASSSDDTINTTIAFVQDHQKEVGDWVTIDEVQRQIISVTDNKTLVFSGVFVPVLTLATFYYNQSGRLLCHADEGSNWIYSDQFIGDAKCNVMINPISGLIYVDTTPIDISGTTHTGTIRYEGLAIQRV